MIAHAALKLKVTFAPRFASIQSITSGLCGIFEQELSEDNDARRAATITK